MTRFFSKILLAGIFLLLPAVLLAQLSGTYTIGGAAPDYTTFNDAVDDLETEGVSGPTTFNVRNGVYQESVLINGVSGTSVDNTVTFQSESGDSSLVELWHDYYSSENYIFRIQNVSNLTIRGLTVRDEGLGNGQTLYISGGDNILIENNHIEGKVSYNGNSSDSNYGLAVRGGASNVVVQNNYIFGGKSTCSVSSSFGNSPENVFILNNTIIAGSDNGHQLLNLSEVINPVVKFNHLEGYKRTLYILNCNGYDIGYNTIESTISGGQRVCDIWFNSAFDHTKKIYNNSFNATGSSGTGGVQGVISFKDSDMEIIHNTFRYESSDVSHAILILESADGVTMVNNNFAKLGSGKCIAIEGTVAEFTWTDHNNFYSEGVLADDFLETLEDWQSAYGGDSSSIDIDPMFVAAYPDSLIPQEPLVASGATPDTDILDDINQEVRNSDYPSIGAFETVAAPIVNLGEDGSYCESLVLDAGNPGSLYLWSNGATGQTIEVSQSGTYSVTVINDAGIEDDSIVIDIVSSPELALPDSLSICEGGAVELDTEMSDAEHVWSTGDTTSSITIEASGTYSVTVTDDVCSVTDSTIVNAAASPNIDLGEDTTFCNGSSFMMNAGAGTLPVLWSTGETTDSISVDTSGVYWVEVTDDCGTWSDTLELSALPEPELAIDGDEMVCEGEIAALVASGGESYEWGNGVEGDSLHLEVENSGFVTVTGLSADGCSKQDSIFITLNPLPELAVNGDQSVCEGDTTLLTAEGAESFDWSNGEQGSEIEYVPEESGYLFFTGTSAAGCSTSDSILIEVHPLPPLPTISQQGEILLTSDADAHQWYDSTGVIDGATSQVFTPGATGNYQVEIIDENGCSAISNPFYFVFISVEEQDDTPEIKIFPNPSSGEFNLKAKDTDLEGAFITVRDARGRMLYHEKCGTSVNTYEMDLTELSDGIYSVTLKTEKGVANLKLVIAR